MATKLRACPECKHTENVHPCEGGWKCYRCGCEFTGGIRKPATITFPSPLAAPEYGMVPYELAGKAMADMLEQAMNDVDIPHLTAHYVAGAQHDAALQRLVRQIIEQHVHALRRRGA